MLESTIFIAVSGVILILGVGFGFARFYRKVGPEEAFVRSGQGGLRVATGQGMWVIPVLHRVEKMDLSVKRIEIARQGEAGLICKDNIRADIEVAFFVRVNNTRDDILQVAQSLGCKRASERQALVELFDAKFSEALKTVGKRFDFVELYNERDKFKEEILKVIGTDLNGYVLDDCAIDYLEQTPMAKLDPQNILDAQGIKKITDLTSKEHVFANEITREKEKVIKKQDVEAAEAIYELERQRVEAEQKQQREIANIEARELAAAEKVREEERLKAEKARIATDEELQVAEENKQRQVIVAEKNKLKTEAIENERVQRERQLEATERERVVGIADIEKEKVIEVEKRNIQDVIRERVVVERAVVEEQERIRDTEEFAAADRLKKVTVTKAEMQAQEALVMQIKAAEAAKAAAEFEAEQRLVEAEALRAASEKETKAKMMLAEARTAEQAADGLAEAKVQEAKADSLEKEGAAEANVLQKKAVAEAKGVEAMATATEKKGTAEAHVMQLQFAADAKGIEEKAHAMKLLDGVGQEHEEFKLRLNKDRDVEFQAIAAQQEIAGAQATVLAEALRSARIDIVGGETEFFDKLVSAIKNGKAIDRLVYNSDVLGDVKQTFFNGDPEHFQNELKSFVSRFGMSFDDVKDLTVSALIMKMLAESEDDEERSGLQGLLTQLRRAGISGAKVAALGLGLQSDRPQKQN